MRYCAIYLHGAHSNGSSANQEGGWGGCKFNFRVPELKFSSISGPPNQIIRTLRVGVFIIYIGM